MKRLLFLLTLVFVFAFGSNSLLRVVVSPFNGDDPNRDRTEVCTRKRRPPPHAPAHGYRAKHSTGTIPTADVYHDPNRNMYFYMKGDGWQWGISAHKLAVQSRASVNSTWILTSLRTQCRTRQTVPQGKVQRGRWQRTDPTTHSHEAWGG